MLELSSPLVPSGTTVTSTSILYVIRNIATSERGQRRSDSRRLSSKQVRCCVALCALIHEMVQQRLRSPSAPSLLLHIFSSPRFPHRPHPLDVQCHFEKYPETPYCSNSSAFRTHHVRRHSGPIKTSTTIHPILYLLY